ncbi:hypothetical protein, partial [Streptomyces sp. DW26H14]|uniref:hypothetical protein n=1 Tax=Streptomyces sp. DW26H14 TaxID=3435395 RepID=UPI00403E05DF
LVYTTSHNTEKQKQAATRGGNGPRNPTQYMPKQNTAERKETPLPKWSVCRNGIDHSHFNARRIACL